jgi:hypothetical protein
VEEWLWSLIGEEGGGWFGGEDRSKVGESSTMMGREPVIRGEVEIEAKGSVVQGSRGGGSESREEILAPVEDESQRDLFSASFSASVRDKKRWGQCCLSLSERERVWSKGAGGRGGEETSKKLREGSSST